MKWLFGLSVAAWLVAGVAVVAGATERSSDEVSRITREVTEAIESPYCPGQSLAMCPSASAAEVRRDIQEMAYDGMEADEIKEELIVRYGDGYELIEPPMTDQMTLLGGIVGGLALAVVVVGFLARRRLSDEEDNPDGEDPPGGDAGGDNEAVGDDIYLEELRAEVEN